MLLVLPLSAFGFVVLVSWLTRLPQRLRARRADRAHYNDWRDQLAEITNKLDTP